MHKTNKYNDGYLRLFTFKFQMGKSSFFEINATLF